MHDMIRTWTGLALCTLLSTPAAAQDWSNYGGGPGRNGQARLAGPTSAIQLWSTVGDSSLIAWHPFIEDGRVFTVRESGFPQTGGSANDALVAYDIYTGTELWRTSMAFGGNTSTEWIAWIGGVRDGRVYASRSSNLQPQPIKAYDVTSGNLLWTSAVATEAWAHDGIVFAPNGDLIVGDRSTVVRIDASTGSTVWQTSRSCPVSGNCGAAATSEAVYIDEAAGGGNRLTRLDLTSGAVQYTSPTMAGFTDQNSPFVSPDGATVYFSRTQNNPVVDFLYAFHDDGTQFVQLWSREVRWTTSHEHGIARDGSIYTFTPSDEFVRLDPATGAITANAGVLSPIGSPNLSPKTAVDVHGRVYVSNGWGSSPASDGRIWAFNSDLSQNLFTLQLDRQNAGGPVLGGDGIMITCDRSAVRAYRDATVGTSFCESGSPGLVCPCGNSGAAGEGCANTTTLGAILGGSGTTSASANDLALTTVQLPPNRFGLIFSGTKVIGQPFGDGVRCAGGSLRRYGVKDSGSGGTITQLNAISVAGLGVGDTRHFQCWYRDNGGPCNGGFNTSNALTVTLRP